MSPLKDLRDHPIRAFAVLCVAVIAGYLMWVGSQVVGTLSGPGWCRAALGAEKVSATDGTIKGLDACVGLFTVQLRALANVAYIYSGTLALCLLTLIVIVIAKGQVSGKASMSGVEFDIGDQPAAKAADAVAGAAVGKAAEIKQDTGGV